MTLAICTATYGTPQRLPIAEDHPQRPINPYGESKLFVEKVLSWYEGAYGIRYMNLRYFNAAGADPDGDIGEHHTPETHLVPLVIAAAQGDNQAAQIFETDYETRDGTAVRDYVHVSDLATAHVRAIDHLLDGGRSASVNLGTGRGYSVRDVITMVEGVSCRTVPVIEAPRRRGGPADAHCGSAARTDALGLETNPLGSPKHRADCVGMAPKRLVEATLVDARGEGRRLSPL